MEVRDVDLDGSADIVILTGKNGAPSRDLIVLWNDGSGHFDQGRGLKVNDTGEVAAGFAFVVTSSSPGAAPSLAYVTQTTVRIATITTRVISARDTIDTPRAATGIAAGDVDGDGVEDLALVDAQNLVLLIGQPVLK
jgi:hypothetical protein